MDESQIQPKVADADKPATIEIHTLDGEKDSREVTVADLGIEDIPIVRPSDAVLVRESPTLIVRENAKWTEYVSVWHSRMDADAAMHIYADQCETFSINSVGNQTTGTGSTADDAEVRIVIEREGASIRIQEAVRVSTAGW